MATLVLLLGTPTLTVTWLSAPVVPAPTLTPPFSAALGASRSRGTLGASRTSATLGGSRTEAEIP